MALFARHGEGLALTSDGRRFLPYASRLRQIVDEAQRAAEEKGPSEAL
jgi:DNA-binding transcriptional LysR family regulator